MNRNEIQELLHHRDPYLMVDQILEIDQNRISSVKKFTGEEFYLKGHFPGMPVVPGAMLQEFCTQTAGVLLTKFYSPVENYNSNNTLGWAIGVLAKVEFAKYKSVVKPSHDIISQVELVSFQENLFKFSAKVFQNDELKAHLKFQLANLKSSYLA